MPRPCRCREISALPEYYSFAPEDGEISENVTMTLDELETIRLLDCAGLMQEEAAREMNVARTTVTAVYESARRKIADCLLNGKRLVISGGSWQLKNQNIPGALAPKGAHMKRIAVTHENGAVFQHFGHTAEFKLYDVENGSVVKSEVVSTNGQGHGALAGFLKTAGADTLICGGIGGGAQSALKEAGIQLYGGVTGSCDEVVQALLSGTLQYNPNVQCNHHHGDTHGEHDAGHGHADGHRCGNCGK